jgi:hypothetical protein
MMQKLLRLILLVCFCATWTIAQEILNNADIIDLTKVDMGDDIIIAKINAAKVVNFDTSTDALIALRQNGVSSPVIAVMIERSSRKGVKVTLRTNHGPVELKGIFGTQKDQFAMYSISHWVQFSDTAAKIRTPDHRPSVLITSDRDPRGLWWFVRASVYRKGNEQYRYFGLDGGGPFSVIWSGSPESGSIVNTEATEEKPGLWRLTPIRDLKAGEYGLFAGQTALFAGLGGGEGQAILFDFGVDK